jgi:hypothetical protein
MESSHISSPLSYQAGELAVEKEQGLRGAKECQYMDTGEIARD